MNFLILAFTIFLQLVVSLAVYFTGLNRRPTYLLAALSLNLILGLSIPFYLGTFLWSYVLLWFNIHDALPVLLRQPLTGAVGLALFLSLYVPMFYMKWVCIPLVRDASFNYSNFTKEQRKLADKANADKANATKVKSEAHKNGH